MANQQRELLATEELVNLYTKEKDSQSKDFARIITDNQIRILVANNPNVGMRYLLDHLIKASLTSANPALGEVYLTTYYSEASKSFVGVTVWSYQWMIKQASMRPEYKGFDVSIGVKELYKMDQSLLNQHLEEIGTYKSIVATCTVYREGRKDTVYEALWSESCQKGKIWRTRPDLMLKKSAVAGALRWAFPEIYQGVYIEEEIGDSSESGYDKTMSVEGQKMEEERLIQEQKEKESARQNFKAIKEVVEDIRVRCAGLTVGMDKDDKINKI